ncbi:MAG: hypothetical protein NTV33_12835 [Coprothermobacterota bacterium]|nr:hypothetical protein [Coprothermobacterota bacterium]
MRRKTEQGCDNPGDIFFGMAPENLPVREANEFYRYSHYWSNRLVAGDSLLVIDALVTKRTAVKIVDDRGIESPRALEVEG